MEFLVQYVLPVLRALVIIGATWGLAGWARGPIGRFLERHTDPTLRLFLVGAVRPVLLALALPAALDAVGVSITSVIAVLSTVGLAVALSLKGSLSNVASGAILLATRPFEVGDPVTVAGISGRIHRINFLFTAVHTDDGRRVFIANDKVLAGPMERHAAGGKVRVAIAMRVPRAALSPDLLDRMRLAARDTPGAQIDDDAVIPEEIDGEHVRIGVRFWTTPADAANARAALFVALNELTRPPPPSAPPVLASLPGSPPSSPTIPA
jgi:small conductance mechanosensitive channel